MHSMLMHAYYDVIFIRQYQVGLSGIKEIMLNSILMSYKCSGESWYQRAWHKISKRWECCEGLISLNMQDISFVLKSTISGLTNSLDYFLGYSVFQFEKYSICMMTAMIYVHHLIKHYPMLGNLSCPLQDGLWWIADGDHTKVEGNHLCPITIHHCSEQKRMAWCVIKWRHFPRYWPFVREFAGPRWIPRTKASDAEL